MKEETYSHGAMSYLSYNYLCETPIIAGVYWVVKEKMAHTTIKKNSACVNIMVYF